MRLRVLVALAATLAACSGPDRADGGGPDPADAGEPNDSIPEATPIKPGAVVVAEIGYGPDVDYYRFTVPATGAFVHIQTFDASGVTCNGVDTMTSLVEPDGTTSGNVLYVDDGFFTCDEISTWLPPGTYYAVVADSGYNDSGYAYAVVVTVDPGDAGTSAESEPNDTLETANGPYSADALVAGTVKVASDFSGESDWFAVANGSGVDQIVLLETFQGALGSCLSGDTRLYVYDAAGTQLAFDDDSGVGFCAYVPITIPAFTTRYVRVTTWGATRDQWYLLRIDFP